MASLNSLLSGGIKNVQRGQITFVTGSGWPATVIINVAAVNPAKAVLVVTGYSCGGTASAAVAGAMGRLDLINGSQIQATRENAGSSVNAVTISWQLAESY